jgi:hypothetical protein
MGVTVFVQAVGASNAPHRERSTLPNRHRRTPQRPQAPPRLRRRGPPHHPRSPRRHLQLGDRIQSALATRRTEARTRREIMACRGSDRVWRLCTVVFIGAWISGCGSAGDTNGSSCGPEADLSTVTSGASFHIWLPASRYQLRDGAMAIPSGDSIAMNYLGDNCNIIELDEENHRWAECHRSAESHRQGALRLAAGRRSRLQPIRRAS